ncbi:hypothetical protein DFJ63DRAFT_27718 [Scheffersomyces coipomensis]|uniref:uncharacterized protein n=1 Tax=Scheffersomyces coipomensis TaxID=1788519 RepID=UPI00315CC749
MSKKMIRHTPLLTKVSTLPFDLYLYFNEIHSSIEWDDLTLSVALPIGTLLTMTTIMAQVLNNYYNSINVKSNNALFDTDYYNYERIKRSLSYNEQLQQQQQQLQGAIIPSVLWLINGLSTLIVAFSLFNAFQVFTSYKNYKLLYATSQPSTPSSFKGSLNESNSFIIKGINYLLSFIFGKHEIDEDEDDSHIIDDTVDEDEEVWQLNVWDPSHFQLHMAIPLNPINLFVIYNFSNYTSNLLYFISLLILISTSFYFFIHKFLLLVQDKQILYQSMFKEYNVKFINPNLNKVKKDVVIDATRGPFYGDEVLTKYTDTKSKVFITHDVKGKEIRHTNSGNDIDNNGHYGDPQYSRRRTNNPIGDFLTRRQYQFFNDEDEDESEDSSVRWYTSSTPYQNNRLKSVNTPIYNRSPSPVRSVVGNKENRPPNSSYIRSPTKLSPTKEPLSFRSPARPPVREPPSFRSPSRSPSRLSPVRSTSPIRDRQIYGPGSSSPIRNSSVHYSPVRSIPPPQSPHQSRWN